MAKVRVSEDVTLILGNQETRNRVFVVWYLEES